MILLELAYKDACQQERGVSPWTPAFPFVYSAHTFWFVLRSHLWMILFSFFLPGFKVKKQQAAKTSTQAQLKEMKDDIYSQWKRSMQKSKWSHVTWRGSYVFREERWNRVSETSCNDHFTKSLVTFTVLFLFFRCVCHKTTLMCHCMKSTHGDLSRDLFLLLNTAFTSSVDFSLWKWHCLFVMCQHAVNTPSLWRLKSALSQSTNLAIALS